MSSRTHVRKPPPRCVYCGEPPSEDNGIFVSADKPAICHSCSVLFCAMVIEERQARGKGLPGALADAWPPQRCQLPGGEPPC